MHHLIALPALDDNYIWFLRQSDRPGVLVDPGDAEVAIRAMDAGMAVAAILVTHHHGDHVAAIELLQARYGLPVFAPADVRIPGTWQAVADGASIAPAGTDLHFEVMAVPGHPFDARASGCNMLIRDGALLVRSPQDVLEAVGSTHRPVDVPEPRLPPLPGPTAPQRALKDVALLHSMILSRLGPSPLAEDQLLRDLKVTSAQLAPELLTLELDGRIARQPGGLLARVD